MVYVYIGGVKLKKRTTDRLLARLRERASRLIVLITLYIECGYILRFAGILQKIVVFDWARIEGDSY